jgi:hypothetical protein
MPMPNKKKIYLLLSILITTFILSSVIPRSLNKASPYSVYDEPAHLSANLEGASEINIANINRTISINGYGLVNIEDNLTIRNDFENPISSMLIGVPTGILEDLIYFKAKGSGGNTLIAEDTGLIMDTDKNMIEIYFDSSLLPGQRKTILFSQSYKDLLTYEPSGSQQKISYSGLIYPLIPYKGQGSINAVIELPIGAGSIENDWGTTQANRITFALEDLPQTFIEPFLENLGDNKTVDISMAHSSITNLEIQESIRQITISPWGTIRVEEDIRIKNLGSISIRRFNLRIPDPAINVETVDNLGNIQGTTVTDLPNNPKSKQVNLDLSNNRVEMQPNSSFQFTLRYQLNLGIYLSIDWFRQSVQLDMIMTNFDYLVKNQLTQIRIEGSLNIDQISDPPDIYDETINSQILIFESDYVSNLEEREILLTYTIDIFEMLTRPIILLLVIAGACSTLIIIIKKRKELGILPKIEKEQLPLREIREFCSLYEQKNALTLEIRQAEEELKRRKLTKKQYRNLVDKNESRIKQIDDEIKPFKKDLMEASQTFENIVQKLDVLEAERQTVEDGLKLLESRYRKGKLPSRSAYVKLTNDFLKRRKKIDRTISRFIQQLRSYLL